MSSNKDKCPIDHEAMQKLYTEHGPIQAELRELVDPLTDALVAQMEADTNERDPVSNWESSSWDVITSDLPYGDNLYADPYVLPPHLFGHTMDNVDFSIPDDPNKQKKFLNNFTGNRPTPRGKFATLLDFYLLETIPEQLDAINDHSSFINPDKWAKYLNAANAQLNVHFHLEAASVFRHGNIQNMLQAKPGLVGMSGVGKFESYMYRTTNTIADKNGQYSPAPTGFLFIPIGEYGPEFSEKLLKTTLYTIERAGETCEELANQLVIGHEAVITTHMARGRDAQEGRNPGEALLSSLQEGALSITQTIALLTAQKVEGYEDPVQLTRAIIDGGLIEQFTRAVPMGLVGPFVFAGRYFKDVIQNTESGLRLNPEVMDIIKHWRYRQIGEFVTMWSVYNNKRKLGVHEDVPAAIGLPCPAAFAHGAVANLSRSMGTALENIGKFTSQNQ